MEDVTLEAMELFRHGIVARACMDYDTAIRYLARPPEKQTEAGILRNTSTKEECERLFLGSWFRILCELDGETIMLGVARNGYYGNNFTASSHVVRKIQGNKRRERRRKEMEEHEKRRKKST